MKVTGYSTSDEGAILAIFTLVTWVGVAAVGTLGMVVPYKKPVSAQKPEIPMTAELLNVELTSEPITLAAEPTTLPELVPLEIPQVQPLEAPALTPVAEPSQVAFALPVEGPTQIVQPQQAAYSTPAENRQATAAPVAQSAPQVLTYGVGEGKQPEPEYPYRAKREGQEGTVRIVFLVAENGMVQSAELVGSSAWPLLNEAALKAVREKWRFRPGPKRFYEVPIRFHL